MSVPEVVTAAPVGASDDYVKTPPSDVVDVQEYGAQGDGSHDDRDAIQSALDEAAKSGTPDTVYVPAGTYRISSQLYLRARHSGITLKGDGSGSHLRLDGGYDTNQSIIKIYARDGGTISNLTIRDIRFDGQKVKQIEDNVRGITAIENGNGGDGNLVENVWFHDSFANNCHWGLPGTTIRFVSSWGAEKWHGLGVSCEIDDSSRPIVVEYCYFRENGTHGVDASRGHTVIRNVLSEENGWGGKNTGATYSSRWENVVFRNNDHLGYMTSGQVQGPVEMDNVMAEGNGGPGFYIQGGAESLTIGKIVSVGNNSIDSNDNGVGNLFINDGFPVDATSIQSAESGRGPGLMISSEPTGTIQSYTYQNNAGGAVENDSSVTIESKTEGNVSKVPIPENPTSDKLLVVDGTDVDTFLKYSLTVSGELEKTDEKGTVNSSDDISEGTVDGQVLGGSDAYRFTGDVTDVSFSHTPNDAVIRVDGSEISTEEFTSPDKTLEIDGANVSEYTEYSITVETDIEHSETIGTVNDEDTISGTTATGGVFGGTDGYRFSGEITDATFTGDTQNLIVRVNGDEVPITQFSENVLEIAPADTTEDQEDPIEFMVSADTQISCDATESVTLYDDETTVVGFSYWWPTTLRYSGSLTSVRIPSTATVKLNGEQVSVSEL